MSKNKDFEDVYKNEKQAETAKKKHIPMILGGVITAVLLLAGVVIFGGKVSEMKTKDQTNGADSNVVSVQESDVEDEAVQMEEEVKCLFLTAHENMPVKGFHSALEILKGRLDVLCAGKAYEMEVAEDFIKLTLPTSVFGELELDQVMQAYLSRKMEYFGYHLGTEKTTKPEYIAIKRGDFSSVALENGTVDGFDVSLLGDGATEYPYIKLTFTDAFLEAHGDEIAAWGDEFVLAQDVENANWWYYHLYPEGDGKTFYLVNADDGRIFTEVLYYNLTHDSLAENFYYSIDVNYDTVWEYRSLIDEPGEYQKNANDIPGKTLTIQYRATKELTEGEWFDLKTVLKHRLDTLGEPYAFGMLEAEEDGHVAVIKTATTHMGLPVIELLSARKNDIAVVGGLEKKYVESLRYERNDAGTYSVYATVAERVVEDLERILEELKEKGFSTIYLTVGEIEWLAADIENYEGNGVLVFDQLCFRDGEPLTAEDEWLLRLLEEVCNGDDLPINFAEKTYQLNEDENGAMASADDFMFSYSDLSESIEKRIAEICEEATVFANDETIYVSLHQNTGKDFARESMELVKEIYENCGFMESGFEGITCYLLDENDMIRERGRVFFKKTYGISENIPGYVYVAGVFANGRLEEYKEEFKEIVETDPFFVELIGPHGANWQFEF